MRVIIYLMLLLAATVWTLLRGTLPERRLASLLLAGNVLTGLLLIAGGGANGYAHALITYFALDAALATALVLLAVRSPSLLTIAVAAFQINGTLAHLVKLVAPATFPFSYAVLLKIWAWPMIASLLVARFAPAMSLELKAKHWPRFFTPAK